MATAGELHLRAIDAVNRGHFRRSRALLLRALDVSDEPNRTARIVATLAYVEAELGDRSTAVARCAAALRHPALTPHSRAVIRSQQAVLLNRGGDVDAALALFDLAMPALEPGTVERGNVLINRGLVHLDLGDHDAADRDFASAVDDFDEGGDLLARAGALHNRGYAALKKGDLVAALRYMDEAALQMGSASNQLRAVGEQDRAEVLIAAGQTREAVSELTSALARFTVLRLPRMQAECEFVLGRALLLDDPKRARVLARAAGRRLRRHGNDTWALRADTLEAIADAIGGRRTHAWLATTESLAAELRNHSLMHEAQLLDLHAARVAVRAGELDDANARLRRGRTNTRDSLTERLLERHAKADLAVARGRRRVALNHLRAGLDLLHGWQSSFGSLDLMSSVVGHGRELATTGIQLALEIGNPELVFEWSERARALTTRVVPVRPPRDEQAAADLVEIRMLTVTEPMAGSRDARRLAELRERVRQQAWLGAGSGEVNRIADLAEIVGAIGADTALVSYLWDGRDRVHALVVTDAAREVVDLGPSEPLTRLLGGVRADLDVSASELGEAMARVVRAGRDRRLTEVADVLVAPLLPLIADRRILLTQAGILTGVPWSMLPDLVGRPVTVAPTATRWLQTRDLSDPVGMGFVAGPDVARAVEEVKQSASRWPHSTVLVDADATADRVVELAGRVDLLHLSAHGRHAAENPLFSGVMLAGGPLFGYDLDRLTEAPDVVILSACEVGRSTQRWAEESLGMVNAWLHAGARCVIASPAAVADDEACEVLQDVHRLMAAGTPPGVALAEATADRPTSFVCFGAGW